MRVYESIGYIAPLAIGAALVKVGQTFGNRAQGMIATAENEAFVGLASKNLLTRVFSCGGFALIGAGLYNLRLGGDNYPSNYRAAAFAGAGLATGFVGLFSHNIAKRIPTSSIAFYAMLAVYAFVATAIGGYAGGSMLSAHNRLIPIIVFCSFCAYIATYPGR